MVFKDCVFTLIRASWNACEMNSPMKNRKPKDWLRGFLLTCISRTALMLISYLLCKLPKHFKQVKHRCPCKWSNCIILIASFQCKSEEVFWEQCNGCNFITLRGKSGEEFKRTCTRSKHLAGAQPGSYRPYGPLQRLQQREPRRNKNWTYDTTKENICSFHHSRQCAIGSKRPRNWMIGNYKIPLHGSSKPVARQWLALRRLKT